MTDELFDRGVLGAALLTARHRAGLSQRDLARRAGVTQAVVSRLERGPRQPSWHLFVRLLDAMEMEPSVAVHSKVAALDADVERLRALSPQERWATCLVEEVVGSLLRVFGPAGWALDGEAALLGHGVPLQPETVELAFLDDDATLARLFDAAVGARWIHVAENVRTRLAEIPVARRAAEMREIATEGWSVFMTPVTARLVGDFGGAAQLPFLEGWIRVIGVDRVQVETSEARQALDRWAYRARLGA